MSKKHRKLLKCKKCGETNPEKFYSANTYRTKCKECVKQETHERKKKYPEKQLLIEAKSRAKKLDIEFDIELSDITIPSKCPILGIDIKVKPYLKHGTTHWQHSPSLDRVDPNKGYVKGNVAVISHRANQIKNNGTIDEHKSVVKYMQKYLK